MKSWQEVILDGRAGKFGDRWIKAASIKVNGKIYWHVRHHLIIKDITDIRGKSDVTDQGFLTNKGEHISREEAAELTLSNGQITLKQYNMSQLFSEELWKFEE